MLRIANLEEIQNMISSIAGLVDLQENRDPNFVDETKRWLTKLEKILENNRMTIVGNVAAFRGTLISAERGLIPEGIEFHGRSTGRKIKNATAAYVLRQAGEIASVAILKDNDRVDEAERMCRQLVAVAKAKGMNLRIPEGGNRAEKLRGLWQTLVSDQDITAGTVNIEGLVGPHDALIILDRAIARDSIPE